jgi:hypothetical protein
LSPQLLIHPLEVLGKGVKNAKEQVFSKDEAEFLQGSENLPYTSYLG